MFIALNVDKEQTDTIIEKVEYKLHPTFNPPAVTVTNAPFIVKRIGWGYFEVKMIITWKNWTGLLPKEKKISHELCFNGDGKTCGFVMELDAEKFDFSPATRKLLETISEANKNI